MDSKASSRVKSRQFFSLFDAKAVQRELLSDAVLSSNGKLPFWSDPVDDEKEYQQVAEQNAPEAESIGLSCASCQMKFLNVAQQRGHYKLDWHRYNVKLRLQNKESVSEEQFELCYQDGFSSISGSDSDSSDEAQTDSDDDVKDVVADREVVNKQGKITFFTKTDMMFHVYASIILEDRMRRLPDSTDYNSLLKHCLDDNCWIVLMLSGGHFAAAIFHRDKVIEHKTFHRYTVRAKSGMSQSVRDSKQGGSAPKSAGATIRRYNEAALVKDIQQLFKAWSSHVLHASKIFYRLSVYTKGIFFSGKEPLLQKDDGRIRKIPFITNRPTFKEVQRVHQNLSFVQLRAAAEFKQKEKVVSDKQHPVSVLMREVTVSKDHDDVTRLSETIEESTTTRNEMRDNSLLCELSVPTDYSVSSNEGAVIMSNDPEDDVMLEKNPLPDSICLETDETDKMLQILFDSLYKGKAESMREFLQVNFPQSIAESSTSGSCDDVDESVKMRFELPATEPPLKILNGLHTAKKETFLHAASRNDLPDVVWQLLFCGSDPALKDGLKTLPYNVSASKDVRNTYRRFMAVYPVMYNYQIAQIPSPLTDDMIDQKGKKDKEKKKKQEKDRKARQKAKKLELSIAAEKENCAKETAPPLSDREKRLQAAEARLTRHNCYSMITCEVCKAQVPTTKSFSKHDKTFCSMDCLSKRPPSSVQ